ncbi:RNA polymerase sigma factor [Gracilimonas mengyeensis]|uniref:RNA polymerase sigma factor, sigma-70 family n=1 Tax=Gracilimonas mengyeensis TaxID=1302730 RepID=A0A521DR91_9BACT|nr:sigma-70 family RNA polymerase sigma factor [Gracilimonas mengyeensis]SMO74227.1 RNA polymerase sigma factor, sigma-70 family [Gracilimonas mengyeensis]
MANRVDYSELVEALQKGDDEKASELLSEVIPRLEDYLRVSLKADRNAAKECVQQAFLDVFEQIRKNNIKNSQYIYSYLIKSCKHEFYRYKKRQHRFDYDDSAFTDIYDPEEQYENLLDKERQRILEECLDELRDESREFIEYFIDKPYASTQEAVEKFDISNANVRTRKHRILSRLHHCYKRKSNQ